MGRETELDYCLRREREELVASIAAAGGRIRVIHLELADIYATRAAAIVRGEEPQIANLPPAAHLASGRGEMEAMMRI